MRIIRTTRRLDSYHLYSWISCWGWQVHGPRKSVWGVYPQVEQQELQSRLTMGWTEPISFRFLAPEIAEAIYDKYFDRKRMQGMLDTEFINRVNSILVCFTCAILYHHLRVWPAWVFQDPPDHKPEAIEGMNTRVLIFWVLFWWLINLGRPFLTAEEQVAGGTEAYAGTHTP